MRPNFSLVAKGLILVSIPLCFEVGFVWALVSLQHEAEVQAQQAVQSREIERRLNSITSEMYQFWHLGYETNYQSEVIRTSRFFALYKSTYLPLFNKLKGDYAALDELTKDKPDMNRDVRQSAKLLETAMASLDKSFVAARAGTVDNVVARYHEKTKELIRLVQDLSAQNFSLGARYQHEVVELSSLRQSAGRQLIVEFVLVACALNAVFCVLLALFLVKGIINRISVLRDNTRRLAAGALLNQPMLGNDEIAELDGVFHGMAEAIEETARLKQELVSMLTHDLRSPLTAIQGSLEILDVSAEKVLDAHQKGLVKLAQRNGGRMMRLINDLLDIQKIKDGMMTTVPTEVCLTEVFEEVTLSVSAWIADYGIKLQVTDTALFVYADREKLERVVFNLVSNAIKFSPAGGTITIAAKESGHMVLVSVSDQGGGIPVEQQESIFERFQQLDTNDERRAVGSGLGLTICQDLVMLLGGKIWVESAVGSGTTFYFTLPMA